MAETLKFTYDQQSDVLDIALGRARKAISREIGDDVFVRIDPKTKKVVGFSVLNLTKRTPSHELIRTIPVTARFALARS